MARGRFRAAGFNGLAILFLQPAPGHSGFGLPFPGDDGPVPAAEQALCCTQGGFMLQIRNLNVTMKKDLRQLVKDFTFALGPGDKTAIIGEEGNGEVHPAEAPLRPGPGGGLCGVHRDHSERRHDPGIPVPRAAPGAGRAFRLPVLL